MTKVRRCDNRQCRAIIEADAMLVKLDLDNGPASKMFPRGTWGKMDLCSWPCVAQVASVAVLQQGGMDVFVTFTSDEFGTESRSVRCGCERVIYPWMQFRANGDVRQLTPAEDCPMCGWLVIADDPGYEVLEVVDEPE